MIDTSEPEEKRRIPNAHTWHASCQSTGAYALEGFALEGFALDPIFDARYKMSILSLLDPCVILRYARLFFIHFFLLLSEENLTKMYDSLTSEHNLFCFLLLF